MPICRRFLYIFGALSRAGFTGFKSSKVLSIYFPTLSSESKFSLLVFRGLLMGRAPLRFRDEGSLGYMIRVDVGPLLCEPELKHWCLLLPTLYR
jgi:hypothetical protein